MSVTGLDIVLVEDDGPLANEIHGFLSAERGVELVSDLDAVRPQQVAGAIVFLDIGLPGWNIFHFARRVHLWQAAAVILMSGQGTDIIESTERLLRDLGVKVVARLEKPFQLEDLQAAVEEAEREGRRAPVARDGSVSVGLFDQVARLSTELELRRDRFAFQPQVDLSTGELRGFEVLLLPLEGEDESLSPYEQVAIAKTVPGLHELLVRKAVETGIQVAKRLTENMIMAPVVSVNLDASLLGNPEFFRSIECYCTLENFSSENLVFELIETWDYSRDMFTSEGVIDIRLNGFGIAIDDFGTGRSEIMSIIDLPITEVKFDKAIVHALRRSRKALHLSSALAAFFRNHGIQVVAEGIETEEDLSNARAVGCEVGQGFLFGRKMSEAEILSAHTHARDRV